VKAGEFNKILDQANKRLAEESFERGDLIRVNDGEYYTVEKDKGDSLFVYAAGGGSFGGHIDKEGKKIEKVDRIADEKVPGYASIEDDRSFPCMCNPMDRWNGWNKPFFTEEVFKDVLDYYDLIKVGDDGDYEMYHNRHEVEEDPDFDKEEASAPVYRDSDGLYTIDGWIWTFQAARGE